MVLTKRLRQSKSHDLRCLFSCRFGFLKDFPYGSGINENHSRNRNPPSSYRYVHFTGTLFMTLLDSKQQQFVMDVKDKIGMYGYVWRLNNVLTKRWKSSVTIDHETICKLVKHIKAFCDNKDGKLAKFLKTSLPVED